MAKSRVNMKIDGVEQLHRKLDQIEDGVAGIALMSTIKAAAEPVQNDASRRAPRLTGRLAGSIIVQPDIKEKAVASVKIGPDQTAFYGAFQEFGTSKMPAQPFLRPAFYEKRATVLRRVRAEFKRKLAEIMGP